jgi:hypothetical protein
VGALEVRNILRNCWKTDLDGTPVFKIYFTEEIQEKHLTKLPILSINSTIFEAIQILQEYHLILVCKNKHKPNKPQKCIGVITQNSFLKFILNKFELKELLSFYSLSEFSKTENDFISFYLEAPATQVFLAMSKYKLSSMPILDIDGSFRAHVSANDLFYFLLNDITTEDVTIATYLNLVNARISLQSQSSFLLEPNLNTLEDAALKLLKLGSHHLWCIQANKPINSCSITDVYRTLVSIC